MPLDLSKIILVNESSDLNIPGDVVVFRDHRSAVRYLEPIDVQNNEFVALSGDGRLLTLSTDGENICVDEASPAASYPHLVRKWLLHMARAVAAARAKKKHSNAVSPTDEAATELLVDFVGFTS